MTKKPKTMADMLPDLNKPKPNVDQLEILVGCRVRLTSEKQEVLKKAWRIIRDQLQPKSPAAIGGTSIKSISNAAPSLGNLTSITISSIIGSRESIPLTTILNLQNALNVVVYTPGEVLKAMEGYVDYVFSFAQEKGQYGPS